MQATFVELPAFQRTRDHYFDDESFSEFQTYLMEHPEAGDVIRETGGLRKIRYPDARRGKGKRSGLRVIYFWRSTDDELWLFSVFDKDEAADLSTKQRSVLRTLLEEAIRHGSNKK